MNTASLVVGLLLLGQTGPVASPRKSPLGPRYPSAPAAGNVLPVSDGTGGGTGRADPRLPSLPEGATPRYSEAAPGSDRATTPGGNAFAPPRGAELDAIDLPQSRIDSAVGENPFPPPAAGTSPRDAGNPLRGASGGTVGDGLARDEEFSPLNRSNQPNDYARPGSNSQPAFNAQPGRNGEQPLGVVAEDEDIGPARTIGTVEFEPSGSRAVEQGAETYHVPASSFTPAVVDDRVTPASAPAGSELVAVRPPEKESTSERLLREALTPPEMNGLAGKPLTLDELLANREAAGERHANMVRSYWQLCSAVARYHWALEEMQILEQVTAGRQVPLAAAAELAALRARVSQTKAVAVEAQHAVAVYRLRPAGTEAPLPVDRPVVATYRTYYESLFAGRTGGEAARRAQRLHETLPLRLEAARALAESVALAEDQAQPRSNATPQGQLDLNSLIQSLRQLRIQREAFIAEVQLYNQSIADYAVLSVSPGATAASLLPMLIKVKPRAEGTTTASATIQTPQPSLPTILPVGATEAISPVPNTVPGGVIPAGAEIPLDAGGAIAPGAFAPRGDEKPLRSVLVRRGR